MAFYAPERLNVGRLDYSVKAKERGFFGEKRNWLSSVLRRNFPGFMLGSQRGKKRRIGRLRDERVYPIATLRVDAVTAKVYPGGSTLILYWVDP
jgi:hypothetical protein